MTFLDDLSAVVAGLPFTISLTLASFLFGALLGLPLCAMRMSRNRLVSFVATVLILIGHYMTVARLIANLDIGLDDAPSSCDKEH